MLTTTAVIDPTAKTSVWSDKMKRDLRLDAYYFAHKWHDISANIALCEDKEALANAALYMALAKDAMQKVKRAMT